MIAEIRKQSQIFTVLFANVTTIKACKAYKMIIPLYLNTILIWLGKETIDFHFPVLSTNVETLAWLMFGDAVLGRCPQTS